jgi:putative ABC transport system ATP-binding protein
MPAEIKTGWDDSITREECAVISLRHVTREYAGRGTPVRALDDATFTIVAGEWVAITGPSGSGKSTLVNLIGCLDRPTAGTVKIDNVDTNAMSPAELDRFRADKIGFIFQQFHLIPYLSAIENVMLAQYFHSMTDEAEAASDAPAFGALRRRAATRLHRPRAHQQSADPPGRRADWQSGRGQSDHRRRPAEGPAPPGPHHRDGDARP